MLKLKEFLTHYGKLLAAILLGLALVGCGSGGGSDNILCGGDPCSTTADTTDDIDNIVGQGTADSIQFVSAVPVALSIRSAGGDETSVVTFLVTDTAGDPISGVSVSFSLDNAVGGVTLSNTSDTTNVDGETSVIVQSGTTHTSVSITATVDATQESTISPSLTISTGISDFDSFSLALNVFNPHAWNRQGETVNATVRMADFFNNPPPDGTQVSFFTEGGSIDASCSSVAGVCTAVWTGQDPRPTLGQGNRPGRSALLAVVTGAESFDDVNSNGVFDDGDGFSLVDTTVNTVLVEADDRPEPFLDINENGNYDLGEFFVDFNQNGTRDLGDGMYNGPLCTHSSLCSTNKTIAIGEQHKIVMASHIEVITSSDLDADMVDGDLDIGTGRSYVITIGDENGNTLPSGSTIAVTATNGTVESGATNDILSDVYEPTTFTILLLPDTTPSSIGSMKIAVTTGSGTQAVTTTYTYPVTD
ncbi:MAG: Ig-like domain-containing protein [Pseudomonadales bacterium]